MTKNQRNPVSPKRRRALAAVAVLTGALGLAGLAQAGPFGGGHGHPGGGFFGRGLARLMDRLDLTEAQEVAAVRMRRSLREEGRTLRQQNRADVQAMMVELKNETPNPEAVHARIDATLTRMRERAHRVADEVLRFHATLDADQKAELAKAIDRRQARFERMRERRAE